MNKVILKRIEAIEQATQTSITRPLIIRLPPMTKEESEMLEADSFAKTEREDRTVIARIIFGGGVIETEPARPIEELRRLVAEAELAAEKELEANDAKK